MTYKGYDILAEVKVYKHFDFEEEEDGYINFTYCTSDEYQIEQDDITEFMVDGEKASYEGFSTLSEAKAYIDQLVEGSK